MNGWLAGAAALTVAIGLAHSYLGERYILIRLFRRDDLPPLFGSDWFTRRTLRFAWHLTTLAWCGFAGLMIVAARGAPVTAALTVVGWTFALSALVAFAASRGRHLSWVVFLSIALLVWRATAGQ